VKPVLRLLTPERLRDLESVYWRFRGQTANALFTWQEGRVRGYHSDPFWIAPVELSGVPNAGWKFSFLERNEFVYGVYPNLRDAMLSYLCQTAFANSFAAVRAIFEFEGLATDGFSESTMTFGHTELILGETFQLRSGDFLKPSQQWQFHGISTQNGVDLLDFSIQNGAKKPNFSEGYEEGHAATAFIVDCLRQIYKAV
jgi:hypothetical protein